MLARRGTGQRVAAVAPLTASKPHNATDRWDGSTEGGAKWTSMVLAQ